MDIESLSAKLEIREALVRYCRGVDRGDAALIMSAYHEDALDIHGSFRGTPREFAELVVAKFDEAGLPGQHHVTNTLIELDGSSARVETYFLAWRPQRNGATGAPELVPLGGRYIDQFELRDGAWKIAMRNTVFDWLGKPIAPGLLEDDHDYPKGNRRSADPSHMLMPFAF